MASTAIHKGEHYMSDVYYNQVMHPLVSGYFETLRAPLALGPRSIMSPR